MTLRSFLLATCTLIAACGDDSSSNTAPDARPDSAPAADAALDAAATDRCTTTVIGSVAAELCGIPDASKPQHVRIESIQASATHAAVAVVIGGAAAPTAIQGPLASDQLRVLFYGGGPAGPSTLPPIVELQYGTQTETISANATWITAGADVCFDVHDGSATAAPAFALWVTGERGADCADVTTLTPASAYGVRSLYHSHVGALDKTHIWFRPAAGSTSTTPTATLLETSVLNATEIAAAVTCATTFAANTDWQPLCVNPGGPVRHVVMKGATSTASSNYFYTVLGQDANPIGSPGQATGKLIVTGGKHFDASSATYFRFGAAGSTEVNAYETDENAKLYIDGPSTVCYDLGSDDDGNVRFVFWATGANAADCAMRSTLTIANALYDSETDTTTGALWTGALDTSKLNFVKASGAAATMTSVEVSSEPAVLD